jgi:hypothetical protein
MGAGASFNIKCPAPFVSTDALSCVMQCPLDKKFVRQGVNGSYACVYGPNPQVSVPLVTVGSVPFDGTTLAELQAVNPQKHTEFLAERQRVEQALATVYANIDSEQKLADAFKDLQAAENARAESPQAYQAARTAYYTLLKGPAWIAEEKARIAAAEVDPEAAKYMTALSAVTLRKREQQSMIDILNGIKDKVLTLKDDVKYSVNTFSDQLEKVKIQLAMESRSKVQETDSSWAWVNLALNAALVAILLYAIVVLVRRMTAQPRPPAVLVQVPTYTRPSA